MYESPRSNVGPKTADSLNQGMCYIRNVLYCPLMSRVFHTDSAVGGTRPHGEGQKGDGGGDSGVIRDIFLSRPNY